VVSYPNLQACHVVSYPNLQACHVVSYPNLQAFSLNYIKNKYKE